MGRRKKLFLGTKSIGGPTLKSRRVARIVTSKYHLIRNEQVQVAKSSDLTPEAKQEKLRTLDSELDKIGGTNRYQQASIISTQFFKTSKWVLQTLESLNVKSSTSHKLNVLEVGAINIQLKQCGWLNVRAIDVNSQHPLIEECDFFTIAPQAQYDVVVCSMVSKDCFQECASDFFVSFTIQVVNCVTEPVKRGEMLARLSVQIEPSRGVLLLVLPLRCINSKHIGGVERFDLLLQGLGLKELLPKRLTPRLVFFILGRAERIDTDSSNPVPSAKPGPNSTKSVVDATFDWRKAVQHNIARHMCSSAVKQFSKDFSEVPPNEFCLSLSADLLSRL